MCMIRQIIHICGRLSFRRGAGIHGLRETYRAARFRAHDKTVA